MGEKKEVREGRRRGVKPELLLITVQREASKSNAAAAFLQLSPHHQSKAFPVKHALCSGA